MTTNLFPNVVGQHEAKKKIGFYLNGYHHNRVMKNVMFAAAKGQGKSMLVEETAKELVLYDETGKPVMKEDGVTPKKKPYHKLVASSIKNVRSFINGIVIKHLVDKDATLFIDEAHGLRPDVTEALLVMLNPNSENKNTFTYDDYACDIDFSRQTFLFATSESHLVFPPLMDRLARIDLESYSYEDLAKIIAKSAPEVNFLENTLETMSKVVRGNARFCVKLADDVRTFLRGRTDFNRADWNEFAGILSIKPLGLSPTEINLLRFMQERPDGSSLTNLAARSGLSREAVQKDYESFLQNLGLMEITAGKGRQLTGKGLDYLKQLDLHENGLATV